MSAWSHSVGSLSTPMIWESSMRGAVDVAASRTGTTHHTTPAAATVPSVK